MLATYAHTVTLRHDSRGRWIVTHSWLSPVSPGWRHAVKHFSPRHRPEAERHAKALAATYLSERSSRSKARTGPLGGGEATGGATVAPGPKSAA